MGRYDDDAFQAAYDKVLAKWPADREALRVPTPFGTTHVNACGPADAPRSSCCPAAGERPPRPGTPRPPTSPAPTGS